jgi:hypothetical protein
MTTTRLVATLLVLSAVEVGSGAEAPQTAGRLPELLTGVDAATTGRLNVPTNFTMRERLYFAKPGSHRIVKVNFDLAEQEGVTFTITPSPKAQITVQNKSLVYDQLNGLMAWKGRLVAPAIAPKLVNGRTPTESDLERAFAFYLSVTTQTRDIPPGPARRALLSKKPDKAGPVIAVVPANGSAVRSGGDPSTAIADDPSAIVKIRFKALYASWFSRTTRSSWKIEVLEEDPSYHVVFELDDKKLIARGVPGGAGSTVEERQRAFQEFREALQEERQRVEGANAATGLIQYTEY